MCVVNQNQDGSFTQICDCECGSDNCNAQKNKR